MLLALVLPVLALIPSGTSAQNSTDATARQQQARAAVLAAWQNAMTHIQADAPRAAVPVLEQLVSTMPGEHRFRLELARAYFLLQDDEKAAFHFDQAMGANLSPGERRAVTQYQDRIRERRRWQAQFSFAFVPESNPGRRTSAETISIGGNTWWLNQQAESGLGVQSSARLTWTPRLSRDVSGRLSVYAGGRVFENSALNDITLGAEAGLFHRADRGRVLGGGLSASRRWVGTTGFSRTVGLYGSYETRLGARSQLALRGDIDRISHDTLSGRDGWRYRLHLGMNRAINAHMLVRGAAHVRLTRAEDSSNSGTEMGLSVGGLYLFQGGLSVSADLDWLRDRRRGPAAFFGTVRDDRQVALSVGFLHRNIEYRGYAPRLSLHLERRSSTIDPYSYTNARASLGVTRRF